MIRKRSIDIMQQLIITVKYAKSLEKSVPLSQTTLTCLSMRYTKITLNLETTNKESTLYATNLESSASC
jgi:hypothetical protein